MRIKTFFTISLNAERTSGILFSLANLQCSDIDHNPEYLVLRQLLPG
jgi:hypothetical protein